jgi:hypothetical protein
MLKIFKIKIINAIKILCFNFGFFNNKLKEAQAPLLISENKEKKIAFSLNLLYIERARKLAMINSEQAFELKEGSHELLNKSCSQGTMYVNLNGETYFGILEGCGPLSDQGSQVTFMLKGEVKRFFLTHKVKRGVYNGAVVIAKFSDSNFKALGELQSFNEWLNKIKVNEK